MLLFASAKPLLISNPNPNVQKPYPSSLEKPVRLALTVRMSKYLHGLN
jgi:hypothetical protein